MRRSGPVSALVVLLLVVLLVSAGGLVPPARDDGAADDGAAELADGSASAGSGSDEAARESELEASAVPMARHASGLELLTPSLRAVAVGFHEASTPHAEGLLPIGRLEADRNRRERRPADDPRGAPYVVLASRGRGFPSTSSIDVMVPDGTEVLAPISGTVLLVEPYRLYGRHADLRVELVPDAAPGLRVVMIHLVDVRVAAGDRVVAGTTVLAAGGRRFPFASQIDDEVGRRLAHVHLEVQPIDAPRPFASG